MSLTVNRLKIYEIFRNGLFSDNIKKILYAYFFLMFFFLTLLPMPINVSCCYLYAIFCYMAPCCAAEKDILCCLLWLGNDIRDAYCTEERCKNVVCRSLVCVRLVLRCMDCAYRVIYCL